MVSVQIDISKNKQIPSKFVHYQIRGLYHHIMKTKQWHNFVIVCAELAFIYKQHYILTNQINKYRSGVNEKDNNTYAMHAM